MAQWQIGDAAPDAVVQSLNGEAVALSSLWRPSGLVLAFLRHFG